MATEKRTHQIGVRVSETELRRIELRAKLHSPHSPLRPASFLRNCGLDAQQDPSPELVKVLDQVADHLHACRQEIHGSRSIENSLKEANILLRQIVRRIG